MGALVADNLLYGFCSVSDREEGEVISKIMHNDFVPLITFLVLELYLNRFSKLSGAFLVRVFGRTKKEMENIDDIGTEMVLDAGILVAEYG